MTLREAVLRVDKGRVLVVGDVILDHYLVGNAERISPEAPVPVVLLQEEKNIPGGAANVARNIVAAGAQAACIGVIGNDINGEILKKSLDNEGVDCSCFLEMDSRPTTTKMRIMAQNHQMLRLDREVTNMISKKESALLLKKCVSILPEYDAVVVSDYGKGTLSPEFLKNLFTAAKKAGCPVFVDPKGRDYKRYRGATALTPNEREVGEVAGVVLDSVTALIEAAEKLRHTVQCPYVVVTRGAAGLAVLGNKKKPLLIPTSAREVYDVTGAGDTFISWLALCQSVRVSMIDSCRIANTAAGIAVGKVGCATVTQEEVLKLL